MMPNLLALKPSVAQKPSFWLVQEPQKQENDFPSQMC